MRYQDSAPYSKIDKINPSYTDRLALADMLKLVNKHLRSAPKALSAFLILFFTFSVSLQSVFKVVPRYLNLSTTGKTYHFPIQSAVGLCCQKFLYQRSKMEEQIQRVLQFWRVC